MPSLVLPLPARLPSGPILDESSAHSFGASHFGMVATRKHLTCVAEAEGVAAFLNPGGAESSPCQGRHLLQEGFGLSSSPGLCRRGAGWDVILPIV